MPSKEPSWRRHALPLLALWALTLAAYFNSFQGAFVFDNATAILKDPRVHAPTQENVHLIWNQEYWYNSSTTGLYRPFTTFSYLLNFAIFGNGPNPDGYHWFNFLLHLANLTLVYVLGLKLLEDPISSIALAALWGVHPLLTEAVSNIVGRADLLAAFGVLAGLLCHIVASSATGRRRLAWLVGLAGAAAIGIFSKESGAVLPGVMLLFDATWPDGSGWRRRAPGYLAMAIPFAIFFSLRADLHARIPLGMVPFADNPLFGADFWTARLTAVKVIGKYVGLFFLPILQSGDYSYNSVPLAHWRDAGAWLALAVCLGAAVLLVRSYRRAKAVFFFLAFFFVTLAPTSNLLILIGTVMAERFVYLPCLGLAGCVVWAIRAVSARSPRGAWVGVGLVCLVLAACTSARNSVWRTDNDLWSSVAETYPANFKAQTALAETFAASPPLLDRAVDKADRSLEILASLPDAQSTSRPYAVAGMCYRLKGDSLKGPAAAPWYERALAVLLHGQKVDVAERQEILRVNQEHGKSVSAAGWMPLYLELGRAYLRVNDPQKAVGPLLYGRAHSTDPEFSVELSRAWRAQGNIERAAMALMEPVQAGDPSMRLIGELVDLYKQTAPGSCATMDAGAGAVAINLGCPLVRGHMCAAAQELAAGFRQAGQAARADAIAHAAAQNFGCPAQ